MVPICSQFLRKLISIYYSHSQSLLLCHIFESFSLPKNAQTASVDPPRLLFNNRRKVFSHEKSGRKCEAQQSPHLLSSSRTCGVISPLPPRRDKSVSYLWCSRYDFVLNFGALCNSRPKYVKYLLFKFLTSICFHLLQYGYPHHTSTKNCVHNFLWSPSWRNLRYLWNSHDLDINVSWSNSPCVSTCYAL